MVDANRRRLVQAVKLYMSTLDDDRTAVTFPSSSPPLLSSRLHPHQLIQLQQLGVAAVERQQTLISSSQIYSRAETRQRVVAENSASFVSSQSPSICVHFDLTLKLLTTLLIRMYENSGSVNHPAVSCCISRLIHCQRVRVVLSFTVVLY